MAIVFVGGVEGSAANGGNVTLDLTALTGGAASSAATGDVVVVLGAMSASQTVTLPAAYNLLLNQTSAKVGWKEMGATPDTSVTVTGSGSGTNSTAGIAFVYSGVDTASLLATTTTGTSTNPDPPAITTVTPNAVVIAGFGTQVLDTAVTAPSGYAHQFDVAGNDNNDITIGMADKTVASPGTEDPAAWTGVSSAAWRSVSIRLHEARPFVNEALAPAAQKPVQSRSFEYLNLFGTTLVPTPPPPAGSFVFRQALVARLVRNYPRAKDFDPPDLPAVMLTTAPSGTPFFGHANAVTFSRRRAVPLISPDRVAGGPGPPPAGAPFFGYTADKASLRYRAVKAFDPPNFSLRPGHFMVHVWLGTADRKPAAIPFAPPNTLPIRFTPLAPFFQTDWPSVRLKRIVASAPHFTPNLLPLLLSVAPSEVVGIVLKTLESATLEATLALASWTPQSGNDDGWNQQSRGSGGWTRQRGNSDSWTEQ